MVMNIRAPANALIVAMLAVPFLAAFVIQELLNQGILVNIGPPILISYCFYAAVHELKQQRLRERELFRVS